MKKTELEKAVEEGVDNAMQVSRGQTLDTMEKLIDMADENYTTKETCLRYMKSVIKRLHKRRASSYEAEENRAEEET